MEEGEAEELQVERIFEKESSMSNGEKAGRTKEAGETLDLLGTTGIQSCLGLQSKGLGRVWDVGCRQTEKNPVCFPNFKRTRASKMLKSSEVLQILRKHLVFILKARLWMQC